MSAPERRDPQDAVFAPEELLREDGLFRQIYDMQMAIGEEAEA